MRSLRRMDEILLRADEIQLRMDEIQLRMDEIQMRMNDYRYCAVHTKRRLHKNKMTIRHRQILSVKIRISFFYCLIFFLSKDWHISDPKSLVQCSTFLTIMTRKFLSTIITAILTNNFISRCTLQKTNIEGCIRTPTGQNLTALGRGYDVICNTFLF